MNIIKFPPNNPINQNIVFCIVDNTKSYASDIRPYMINQADGVLANLNSKDFTVLQWIDEDDLLKHAAMLGFEFAVVLSTGTEFLNGHEFFKSIKKLIEEDFFIAGHILDRGDAYYEIHHQCYVVNLEKYKELGFPLVGKQCLGEKHIQKIPARSLENYHDDYTPIWVSAGKELREYNHKCHGWKLLSVAFEHNLKVLVFDESIRTNKKHFYPEFPSIFYKNLSWAYYKLNYCRDVHVHTSNTEKLLIPSKKFKQIITPASGEGFMEYATESTRVVMYDYNQSSLDYWRNKYPNYEYVKCDLLSNDDLLQIIDTTIDETLINLSNIFNYEGTVFFYSLEYRKFKEKDLTDKIKRAIPSALVYTHLSAQHTDNIPTWHI